MTISFFLFQHSLRVITSKLIHTKGSASKDDESHLKLSKQIQPFLKAKPSKKNAALTGTDQTNRFLF